MLHQVDNSDVAIHGFASGVESWIGSWQVQQQFSPADPSVENLHMERDSSCGRLVSKLSV